MIRRITIWTTLALLALFVIVPPAHAQVIDDDPVLTTDEIKNLLREPQPRIRIPGVDFTDARDVEVETDPTGDRYLHIPFIGEFISAVYRYAIVVITIMAVLGIFFAGFQWMLPGNLVTKGEGDQAQQINKAKKAIGSTIAGLLIALLSYTLLYILNPNLVEFRNLRILFIPAEIIDTEGEPETFARRTGTEKITSDLSQCQFGKYPGYRTANNKFGRQSGYCLGWVKGSVNDACGGIPDILSKPGAWDVAAAFHLQGNLKACNLNGIEDGDIVFMTSMGSNWIGLWENFREGRDGCTIADAARTPTRLKNGQTVSYPTGVQGKPTGMPPVTHIGVYYGGQVYHLLSDVTADAVSKMKTRNKATSKKKNWNNIFLKGNFIHGGGEFIAGYASIK